MERIVLSRPDRIGDVIISSSCFASVQEAYPEAEIYFVLQEQMTPLFCEHPAIEKLIPLTPDQSASDLADVLREVGADAIVHLHYDGVVEEAACLAEIPKRVGWSRKGNAARLTESVPYKAKSEGLQHEGFYSFELLELIGVRRPAELNPWLSPANTNNQEVGSLSGENYLVFHLLAHGSKPRVPVDFFVQVAAHCVELSPNAKVLLIGNQKDDPANLEFEEAFAGSGTEVVNMCGQTSLSDLANLMKHAGLVVGRDSGPAHLAAAMGAPTLTMFIQPTKITCSDRWHPLGVHSVSYEKPLQRRWFETSQRHAARAFKLFSLPEVLALAEELLVRKAI